ncbi:Uncharacterized protein PRO82_001224 [Candidatus Protochlamydia amoebophila]|uniref:DUF948 domain-containing protein n=1 Tax=Candidatus Protochlamydia amoebophila TaxID=362787 RepID=UPI001BCA1888|nr:DUF948 domain-containing protein [Candidatus Protochlamydia amoebophila]MBS4163916.1 Uncharacterized protein [Candidatus Protochlamydia amoebophila]
MVIEISVAAIAIAFIFLVIYLVCLCKSARVMLNQLNHLIIDVRQQLDGIKDEAKKTIENTNQISLDLKHKIEAFNSLFQSLANIGEALEYKAEAFRQKTLRFYNGRVKEFLRSSFRNETSEELPFKKNRDESPELPLVAEILELASQGCRLWQNLKKRR